METLECLLRLYFHLDLFSCQLVMWSPWKKSCITFFVLKQIHDITAYPWLLGKLKKHSRVIQAKIVCRSFIVFLTKFFLIWYLWIREFTNLQAFSYHERKHLKKTSGWLFSKLNISSKCSVSLITQLALIHTLAIPEKNKESWGYQIYGKRLGSDGLQNF